MLHKTLIILTLTLIATITATQAMASPRNLPKSQVKPVDYLQLDDTTQLDLSSIICPQAREGNKKKIVDSGRPPRE